MSVARTMFRGAAAAAVLLLIGGCSYFARKPEPPPAAQEPALAPTEPAAPGRVPGPGPRREGAPAYRTLPPGAPGTAAPGTAAPGTAAPRPPTTYYVHTVKWYGESVSIIAAWYTGDLQNWKVLAEANPDINPNRIHAGQRIQVPEELMKTREPMTQEFVDSFYPKPKKAPPVRAPRQEKEDEAPLFGPK